MKRVFTANQFTIKCVWFGSRIQGGPDYVYHICFNAPNGKQIALNGSFSRKADAKKYIAECCKISNALYEKKEAQKTNITGPGNRPTTEERTK